MDWQNLIWIIPLSLLLGGIFGGMIGIKMGFDSYETLDNFACNLSTDALSLYSDILYNITTSSEQNCSKAFESYMYKNNETILNMAKKYSIE